MLLIPKTDEPGKKDHWQIIECGENIKSIPDKELEKISPEYRDNFQRSEKGLDIRLTCDTLTLVSSGKASSVVFLLNDRDYIPLFNAIMDLGANVYLTNLDSTQKINVELANLADRYLTLDSDLKNIFVMS